MLETTSTNKHGLGPEGLLPCKNVHPEPNFQPSNHVVERHLQNANCMRKNGLMKVHSRNGGGVEVDFSITASVDITGCLPCADARVNNKRTGTSISENLVKHFSGVEVLGKVGSPIVFLSISPSFPGILGVRKG